jgi:hypothetical protein
MTKIEKSFISTLLGICRKSGVLLAVFRLNLADKSVLGTQGMGPQFLDFFLSLFVPLQLMNSRMWALLKHLT